ncbi:jg26323 [Pararge aegeria aegeria]|uniref:Jg26323 protein n=1 Tax=Pararge aegeria aegeria TaxID=348720 RepID=A0A8S4R6U8_9NEOP|nr:jg26323 [Pararge aegeria aegeria]
MLTLMLVMGISPFVNFKLKLEGFQTRPSLRRAHNKLSQDVIHTISTPHGQVQRIVVFKKNGVQAMVEYPFQTGISYYMVWLEACAVAGYHPTDKDVPLSDLVFRCDAA